MSEAAIDRAATKVGLDITAFVSAADTLVNLLATEPQGSEQSSAVHQAAVDAAYNAYDQARRVLTGEDIL